ncbi:MAG: sugar ABC transporter permease [Elusimicrobia bacterium]|nr:sugar ABC transporter permease [Elusimicrobiota bacterium]
MLKRQWKHREIMYLFFVLPALIFFGVFVIYPFIKNFLITFYSWDGINEMKFVGLEQYKKALFQSPDFWKPIKNAAFLALMGITVQNGLALLLAWIVDKELKGARFYRVIFFIPPMLSFVVIGFLWKWILEPNQGILNIFLKNIGLGKWALAWLGLRETALPTVAMVNIWASFGWGFVMFLAALQGIERDIYEAARIDGANNFQEFWKITFPLLLPIITSVSILTILGAMQQFDLIYVMTGGGPAGATEVPVNQMYMQAFQNGMWGYATTLGVLLGVILFLISIFQLQIKKWLVDW